MKKSSVLKYIVYTFAFVVSFFMLFNSRVSASVSYEKDNIVLTLEEEGENYIVAGGYHTCESDDTVCLEKVKKLVIPGTYNEKKVIAIKDAENASIGVLDGLKDVVSEVVVENGVEVIGTKSFYQFSKLEKVELSSSVVLIKNNAFEDSKVSVLKINRNESALPYLTEIESVDAFISMPYLSRIVFPSYGVSNDYREENNYKDLDADILAMFTYEVKYVYYVDGVELPNSSQIYYPGDLVEAPIPVKEGFDFVAWKDANTEMEIKSRVDTRDSIYPVNASWKLSVPTVEIGAYLNGDLDNEVVDATITYGGRNKFLSLIVDVDHYLKNDPKTKISYKWLKDGVGIDVTGNVHEISQTSDDGYYTCVVTLDYGESYDEVSQSVSITTTINRAKVKISVNDNIVTYGTYAKAGFIDGKYYSYTELVDGQIIKNAELPFYTNEGNDIEVNDEGEQYVDVLKIENVVIGYEDSDEDYSSNYEIEYDYGDLTVNVKEIQIDALTENIIIKYGEDESVKLNKSYTVKDIYGKDKEISVTYVREKMETNVVGSYRVESVIVSDQKNFSATLAPDSVGKVIIIARSINVDWTVDSNLTYNEQDNKWHGVYDKTEKVITAKYTDIENNDHKLFVGVVKNDVNSRIVNAGEYVVTAYMEVYNGNYVLSNNSLNIFIDKADSYFLEDKDYTQTKEYNGSKQVVDVTINHNEAGEPSYFGEDCVHAQSITQQPCAITVSYAETENYKAVSEVFYLRIKPIVIEVEPDLFVLPYGSSIGMSELKKLYKGINDEDVWVYFSKQGSSSALNVGFYNIGSAYIIGTSDYEVDMTEGSGENMIQIVPAEVEVRFYYYEGLVYDGNVKNIVIQPEGTIEDIGLQVDYNGKEYIRDAGSYRIDLSLTNPNYKIKGDGYLEFEIAKADYNIKNLSFKDKEVKFDFKSHTLVLDGELPKGLNVQYTIDGEAGNGTYLPFKHKVKVTFIGDFDNYNYIDPIEATLYVNATWFIVLVSVTLVLIAACIVGFILLVKYEIIKFTDKEQRRRLRRVIRGNKAILAINEMFRENKKILENSKEEEEEIVIEEDVTFVKNVVATNVDTSIELSFVDELYKSDVSTKEYYSEVKNELLSYEGIVSKIKRDYETFYVNNIPVAKFDIVDGSLIVYFALDPTSYKKEEYNHENVSKNKDFAAVPLKLKVKTIESLRHAKMFVRIIRKREKLKFTSNFIRTDYVSVYTAKDNSNRLFKKKKVKKGSKEALED